MITLKLEDSFLKQIDENVKNHNYHSRTEFIRNALREHLEKDKMKEIMLELSKLQGKSKKKVTDEEYEKVRKSIAYELFEKFK